MQYLQGMSQNPFILSLPEDERVLLASNLSIPLTPILRQAQDEPLAAYERVRVTTLTNGPRS